MWALRMCGAKGRLQGAEVGEEGDDCREVEDDREHGKGKEGEKVVAKNKGGVPAQSKQNAEAKASGTRNLEDWLSTQGMEMKTITLKDDKFNYRLTLQRDKSSPRRTDEDDDDAEMALGAGESTHC